MKKILIIIIIVIVALFLLIFHNAILMRLPWNMSKAETAAKEYVAQNFQQEINYIDVEVRSSFEPLTLVHEAYFSPKDNPNLKFSVIIGEGFRVTDDNYFVSYFEYQIKELFIDKVKELWGQEANFYAKLSTRVITADTPGMDQLMTIEEGKEYLGRYSFSVGTNKLLNDKQLQSLKILEFFKAVKGMGYDPYHITISYIDPQNEEQKIYYIIDDWKTIDSEEQIIKYLDSKE